MELEGQSENGIKYSQWNDSCMQMSKNNHLETGKLKWSHSQ